MMSYGVYLSRMRETLFRVWRQARRTGDKEVGDNEEENEDDNEEDNEDDEEELKIGLSLLAVDVLAFIILSTPPNTL